MERLVIKDQDSLDKFENLTDTNVLLDVLMVKQNFNGRLWIERQYDKSFMTKVFGKRKFGTSETSCDIQYNQHLDLKNPQPTNNRYYYNSYYAQNGQSKPEYPNTFSIRYDNLDLTIKVDFTNRIAVWEYEHLRVNTKRDITVYIDADGEYYLRFKWQDFYSEVKRINSRNKKTSNKSDIKKLGLDFKIDNLIVKLEEKGYNFFTASKTSEYRTKPYINISRNYSSIHIELDPKDKGDEIEINEKTGFYMTVNNSGTKYVHFDTVLKTCEMYKNVLKDPNDKG